MSDPVSGTEGYAATAATLIPQWQAITFADQHGPALHLIPGEPSDVLDIGAGIGNDAAALATMGHRVVAVEPVDEFRLAGMRLHPAQAIEWVADSLPALHKIASRHATFDLITLMAVWMHLDAVQRRHAMAVIASLLRPAGTMIMSLRHGPVPSGRRMFAVTGDETIRLAGVHGFHPVLNLHTAAVQQANRSQGVTFTRLAFIKARQTA